MNDTTEPEATMTPKLLADYRASLGYTQIQMADAMGLSRRAYIDIETGKSPLRKIHESAANWVMVKSAARGAGYIALPFEIGETVVLAGRK